MSKVCDGLRGDAIDAAQEVGFDNLCEIVDGRQRGIDTQHMRGMGYSLWQNTNPKNYSANTADLEDLCPDKPGRA